MQPIHRVLRHPQTGGGVVPRGPNEGALHPPRCWGCLASSGKRGTHSPLQPLCTFSVGFPVRSGTPYAVGIATKKARTEGNHAAQIKRGKLLPPYPLCSPSVGFPVSSGTPCDLLVRDTATHSIAFLLFKHNGGLVAPLPCHVLPEEIKVDFQAGHRANLLGNSRHK